MMYNNKMVASIKVAGKIMREDQETVYLPFGSEYSMLLKNLNSKKALLKIEIDGQEVSPNGLIIHPNQTIDLERFIVNGNMNEGPRFKFIEKTEEISDYRGDNVEDGILRISYQYEAVLPTTWIYPSNVYGDATNVFYKGSLRGSSGGSGGNQVYGVGMDNFNVGCSLDGATHDSNVTVGSTSVNTNQAGITTHGSKSEQSFSKGHIGLLEAQEHVICLQLKGQIAGHEVQAPVTVDVSFKCPNCGKSSSSKFCPNDGTNLTYQY